MARTENVVSKKQAVTTAEDKNSKRAATSKTVPAGSAASKASAGRAAAKKDTAKADRANPAKKAVAAKKTTAAKKSGSKKSVVSQGKTEVIVDQDAKIPSIKFEGVTMEGGRYALPSAVQVKLPAGYEPSEEEEYMNPLQLAYFRKMLNDWRHQLVEESRQTMENLAGEVRDVSDDAERATRETENSFELRTRDRYRKLLAKIDKSLRLIEMGEYGYCQETDEEIGLKRLQVRPIATLSLDAQERREHLRKQMGD